MAGLDREFGFGDFEIRVNNRLILNGFLELEGVSDKATPLLRELDKLPKIGRENVILGMVNQAGVTNDTAHVIVDHLQSKGTSDQTLTYVQQWSDGIARTKGIDNKKVNEGVQQLRELLAVAKALDVPENRIRIDLAIARGLDYYTGTIYETFLQAMPGIGSVCSGGRYDNLASLYTKQVLPGVGASLGLDRLLAALEELGKLDKTSTPAPVIVFCMAMECLGDYQRIGRMLRTAGIGVEVYPDAKKIGQQFQYAERRGHKVALIAGPGEFAKGVCNVKDLAAKEQKDNVPEGELLETLKKMLSTV
jgi:histidyl-tRNA synthetase